MRVDLAYQEHQLHLLLAVSKLLLFDLGSIDSGFLFFHIVN